MIRLTKPEKTRLDATLVALRAIDPAMEFPARCAAVIAALRGCGPCVWQWIDEGPGYGALGDSLFAMVRSTRNHPDHCRPLFAAVNARGRAPKVS